VKPILSDAQLGLPDFMQRTHKVGKSEARPTVQPVICVSTEARPAKRAPPLAVWADQLPSVLAYNVIQVLVRQLVVHKAAFGRQADKRGWGKE